MALKMKEVHGTGHHVPEEVIPFLEGLEKIVGADKIGYAKFIPKGSQKRGAELRHYDPQKKMVTLRIDGSEYMQVIYVKADITQIQPISHFVKTYKF